MLKQSPLFTGAVKSDARSVKARVTVNGIVYDDDKLMSIEGDLASITGEEFAIGSAVTDTVTIVFSEVIETIVALDRVKVEIGVDRGEPTEEEIALMNMKVGSARMGGMLNEWGEGPIEFVSIGEFIITEHVDINYNENKTTITCKDKMVYLEDVYVSQLSYPAFIGHVVLEIANQAGVEVDIEALEKMSGIKINEPVGYTHRQALGLIAQIEVGFVTFNRKGKLQIKSLQMTDYTVSKDEYFSFVKMGIRYRVGGITCIVKQGEETIMLKAGQNIGPQINIENNVMTQDILDHMFAKLQTIDFYPYTLEWRGNPSLEVGDLFTITDNSGEEIIVPNLNYKFSYNGGLKATSSAETKSRADIIPSGRQTLQQQINGTYEEIKRVKNNVEDAFKEAQAKITGNQGGFVVTRLNQDDKPYEILVMDVADVNQASNVIRINQQGIAFSRNGYNGPFGIAMTIDGQIVADYITAGKLRSDLIQTGFNEIANGLDVGVSITSEGLVTNARNGSQALLQNGTLLVRGTDKKSVGYIGFSQDGDNNNFTLTTANGRSFQICYSNADGTFTPLIEYLSYLDSLYFGKRAVFQGNVDINGNVDMNQGQITEVQKVRTGILEIGNIGSILNDLDNRVALKGTSGAKLGVGGQVDGGFTPVLMVDSTRAYIYKTLSMEGNDITNQSDERLKENIVDADYDGMDLFRKMRPRFFEWLNKERFGEQKELGFIAQELKELDAELVTQTPDEDAPDGIAWAINETQMNRRTWIAVHQLVKEFDTLKSDVSDIKTLLV